MRMNYEEERQRRVRVLVTLVYRRLRLATLVSPPFIASLRVYTRTQARASILAPNASLLTMTTQISEQK